MKKRKPLVITGIILGTIVLLTAAIVGNGGTKPEVVKTTNVTQGDLKSYLSTNAVVKSKKSKSYPGTPQLTVTKVNVKPGDQVKKGQVMIRYDLFDLNAGLAQAKLQYENAQLQKNDLIKQKEQIDKTKEKLAKEIDQLQGSQNPTDLNQVQSLIQKNEALQTVSEDKVKLMENSVALAKLALDAAASKLAKSKEGIAADFDGVVTEVNAVEETVLNPSQPAIVVQQLDNLKAVISLGKYEALKVRVGQEAVLKNGDNVYKGMVSFISPTAVKTMLAGGQEANLEAEIDIKDERADLKVDFDTNVDILLGAVKDALKIPIESIQYDKSGKSFVFKLNLDKAEQREVILGLQSDMEAQVLSGLSLGDTVILNPSLSLKDGAPIKVHVGEQQ